MKVRYDLKHVYGRDRLTGNKVLIRGFIPIYEANRLKNSWYQKLFYKRIWIQKTVYKY